VYLSRDSLDCEIVSAKSSEMNILVPEGEDDYVSVFTLDISYLTLVKTSFMPIQALLEQV